MLKRHDSLNTFYELTNLGNGLFQVDVYLTGNQFIIYHYYVNYDPVFNGWTIEIRSFSEIFPSGLVQFCDIVFPSRLSALKFILYFE